MTYPVPLLLVVTRCAGSCLRVCHGNHGKGDFAPANGVVADSVVVVVVVSGMLLVAVVPGACYFYLWRYLHVCV